MSGYSGWPCISPEPRGPKWDTMPRAGPAIAVVVIVSDGPGPRADQGDLVVFLACSAHIRVPAGGVVTDDEAELRRRIVTFAAATEQ